jgi:membrane protein implicated in regulation of membrane protease activity
MKDDDWQLWLLARYPRVVAIAIIIGAVALVFVGVVILGALFIWGSLTALNTLFPPPVESTVMFAPLQNAGSVLICLSPFAAASIWLGYRHLNRTMSKREKKK